MSTEHPTNRRTILKEGLGVLGLGVTALVLGSQGRANADPQSPITYTCCRDTSCPECHGTPLRYRCVPNQNCNGGTFCDCFTGRTNCFTLDCS